MAKRPDTDGFYDLIKSLCELASPVGQEQVICDAIEALWRARGLPTERTRVGNVLARGPKGKRTRKKLLMKQTPVQNVRPLYFLKRQSTEPKK